MSATFVKPEVPAAPSRALPALAEPAGESPGRSDYLAGHADGAAFGVMVGLGETYLPAFALAIGLGEVTAGLVSSVPLVAGGLMQTVSPWGVRRLGSHKRWVCLCATVQAISFLPLVFAAIAGAISTVALLAVASLYWATGLATGPAWNTWMGRLVPRQARPGFFALRARISQLAVLAGFVGGGLFLQGSQSSDWTLLTFAGLFAAAGLFRLASVGFLAAQNEPPGKPLPRRRAPISAVWSRLRHGAGARLLIYLVLVQGAVQFAGPYFTPYMFRKLDFSYAGFVGLTATALLAKIVFLPTWGRMAQRLGATRLLWIGGVGIAPVSGMWLLSDNYAWLLVIQVVGGAAWAAYELAFFLLFFDSIPEEERTGVLTFYNLANTSAWVAGSLLGGLLLGVLGAARETYLLVFGLSTVARALPLLMLWRMPSPEGEAAPVAMRTVAVRPSAAAIDAPVLPSLPEQPARASADSLPA